MLLNGKQACENLQMVWLMPVLVQKARMNTNAAP